ncbi:MAG TPA: NADPH-dependent FMN reductase [Rhodanobacter sp.]
MHNVAVLVGSLRHGSNSIKLARALEKLGAGSFAFRYPDLDLPLYNEDLWKEPPLSVLRMKKDIETADAVLFVTPEYNRSIPPVIKNAIDWGSRPWGQSSWTAKPTGIVGSSGGSIGSAAAQAHLRSIVIPLQMILMGQPEVYFVFKPDAIDEQGEVADESARIFFKGYLDRFSTWIDATGKRG